MLITLATIGLVVLALLAVLIGIYLGRDDRGDESSGSTPRRTDENTR